METETYRTKPQEVEAVKVTAKNFREVAQWCGARVREESRPEACLLLPTQEGPVVVSEDHWVTKSTETGEFDAYYDVDFKNKFYSTEIRESTTVNNAPTIIYNQYNTDSPDIVASRVLREEEMREASRPRRVFGKPRL